jgi:hypothetical protein
MRAEKKKRNAILLSNAILVIHGLMIVFHLMVVLAIIPSDIVWGGSASGIVNENNIILLESVAIFVLILFSIPVWLKKRILSQGKNAPTNKWLTFSLWIIAIYFAVNTIGNLMAVSTLEQFMGILTAILALMLSYLARAQ